MGKKEARKGIGRVHVWGALTVLVCICLICAVIFVPIIKENGRLQDHLDILIDGAYRHLVVSDPLYYGGSALGDKGAEVVLEEEEINAVRTALAALRAEGFRNGENEDRVGGAWDMRLQLIAADGTRTALYFTESALYYVEGYAAYTFYPKNDAAYRAFYDLLIAYLA